MYMRELSLEDMEEISAGSWKGFLAGFCIGTDFTGGLALLGLFSLTGVGAIAVGAVAIGCAGWGAYELFND